MEIIVPYDAARPKTRLSPVLSADERRAFADAMLADVVRTVREAGHTPHVLTTAPVGHDTGNTSVASESAAATDTLPTDVRTTVDDGPLTEAVNTHLAASEPSVEHPLAVVMADLPLVTPETVEQLVSSASRSEHAETDDRPTPPGVTIAPGLGGGTNALVVRDDAFRVDYHGASCRDHARVAREIGAGLRTVDSRRLATDVDEPADLAEVLLHADGRARAWLTDAGFRLATGDGRVTVER